jgi:methionyl-tRNA formyltransferase
MRVVFMGSPEFGLPTLEALRSAHDVALVVSQPDRPAGRSRRPTPPPIAAFAEAEGLPVHQPERLRQAGALEPIVAAAPDVVVVAAYGLILPRSLLALPPLGCLNVHPSLLPRHRGATPIEAAILAGDDLTGVTIIKLTERMDAGPILAQTRVEIGPAEDASSLERRLALLGAELLIECLEAWASGRLAPVEQDEALASYSQRTRREDALLDWSQPAEQLARVVRAFRGRADAYTYWDGRLLKLLVARPLPCSPAGRVPGEVFERHDAQGQRWPLVATGDGALELKSLALAGRRPTSGAALLNGYPRFVGSRLGADGAA